MNINILAAKDAKQQKVNEFFSINPNDSLLIIKANIPGANKNFFFVNYILKVFLNNLKTTYSFFIEKYYESFDGPYYFCGIKGKDEKIKKHLISIEQTHDLGRFIDLDYFTESKKSMTRVSFGLPLRKCILCDNDAIYCMRNKTHTTEQLLHYIEKTTILYFAELVVDLVDYSIIRELKIDNKFGLVSFRSQGSHKDMDYKLMITAKDSILYYFKRMFLAGYQTKNLNTILNEVRSEGIEAEKRMFAATNGINAYKGVIFLLGLSVLSFGYTIKTSKIFDDVFNNIKIISTNIYDDFLGDYNSFGTKLYKEQSITGIRGIAKSGMKIIEENLHKISLTSSDNTLRSLLHYYILNTDDTVFIKRSKSYSNYLKFKDIISQYDPNKDLEALNHFTEKFNLSFGGAADLLIITIFLVNLKELFII